MRPTILLFLSCILACIQVASCKQQSKSRAHDHTHSNAESTERTDPAGKPDQTGHSHADDGSEKTPKAAEIKDAFVVAKTEHSPQFIQHASGVEIIEDIADFKTKVGVETLEGQFGPLLFGSELRAFFIVLRPGQFLAEHPHPTESMVYTVSGKWVLCSEGKRHVMKAGTLFHFGDDKPTGWEAPFDEDAHLLIVKKKNPEQNYETVMARYNQMAAEVNQQHDEGTEFWFHEIPPDHPARKFAARVNPKFDELIEKLKARDE